MCGRWGLVHPPETSPETAPDLLVQPQHGAGHADVGQADPLAHQEGARVEVLVQHRQHLLRLLLGLLCGLEQQSQLLIYSH